MFRIQSFLVFYVVFGFFSESTAQELLSSNDRPIIKNLVMEGGGIKGIAYGGALLELEKKGILQNVSRVAGTSAGAIQACLLALGYEPKEIIKIIAETPVESFNDDGSVLRASKRMINEYGWFKGDSFLKKIEDVIFQKTGNANLTFADLHTLASSIPFRDLYVTGSNLSEQTLVVFSYETYPEMRVADAVRVSMSIPLYYRGLWVDSKGKTYDVPQKNVKTSLFADGGLLLNFPIDVFDNEKYINGKSDEPMFNNQTLGFRLERCTQIDHELNNKDGLAPFEINDMSSYMAALSGLIMRNVNPPNPKDYERTIYINDNGMSARVRKIEPAEKNLMLAAGQLGVIEYFNRKM